MVDAGTVIDGRYKVISRIGSGGMADVYLAEDSLLGRRVAVKLLHHRFAADQEFVERFRREASSAAGLSHPNVVSVFDRGEWDGTYYIAMEYLPGRSLKSIVRERGPLPPQDAIDIVAQILLAVRFAHKRGIIHRDIKPHNVILDEEGRAKVTDFGIARAGASDMTLTGSIMGTAQYLSPEQAQGHAVSETSDLYAVGVVLYELLTGVVPFEGESPVTVALKQVSAEPAPPSLRNPAVTPALDALVMHALAKDPANRFRSADEFLAGLSAVREGTAPTVALAGSAAPGPPATAETALLAAGVPIPPPRAAAGPGDAAAGAAAAGAAGVAAAGGAGLAAGAPLPAEPPPPPGAGRRNRVLWWTLAAALALAAAVLLLLLLLSPASTPQVRVPAVTGQPQAAALASLRRAGLRPAVSSVASATVPSGVVASQSPAGGARVDKGSSVSLLVSSGPGSAALPDVSGKSAADALKILREKGFKPTTQDQSSETVPKGHAISTDPAAGTVVQVGSAVTVLVSTGPAQVSVPEVRGEQEATATSALASAGLKAVVKKREVAEPAPGTVISQSPAAGTKLKRGSTVTLTVAEEVKRVEVPELVGESEAQAVSKLSSLGFASKTVSRAVTDPSKVGVVVQQSPEAGKKLIKGAVVTIAVGQAATTTSTSAAPPPAAAPPAAGPPGG